MRPLAYSMELLAFTFQCRASQEERISILKMALTEKGVRYGTHYDLDPSTTMMEGTPKGATTSQNVEEHGRDDDGIHL